MKKRILSMALALAMCFTMLPTAAFAEGTPESADSGAPATCICETECAEGELNLDCPVCGATDADLNLCTGVEPEEEPAVEQPTVEQSTDETPAVDEAVTAVQAQIDALPTADEVAVMDTAAQNVVYGTLQTAYDAYDALTAEQQAAVTGTGAFETLFDWFNSQTMPLAGEVAEQFSLAPGGTYYFDLSDEVGKIGTINAGKTGLRPFASLPDTTLHYVPFTYVGTVNAYSLATVDNGRATTETYANGLKSDRSLFVAEYNVSHTVTWDALNSASLIFGETYHTNYILRSLSAGSATADTSTNLGGTPATNEWDQILNKNSAYIKNWSNIYSLGQDTQTGEDTGARVNRGYWSADYRAAYQHGYSAVSNGWRPALEVLDPAALGADGLKSITLNLNGGKLKDAESINIICAGETFTAPGGVGLTRPTGNTDTYFMWNTQADGDGTAYAAGDKDVPSTVTTLYAQWAKPIVANVTVDGIITPYTTFAEALAAAQAADTASIRLLKTVSSADFTVAAGKKLSIDLNGVALDCTKIEVANGGTLNMSDSSEDNSGKLNGAIFTDGELNISGGTYLYTGTTANYNGYARITILAQNNSTGTISGGVFKRNNNNNSYVSLEYNYNGTSTLSLTGGTFDMIDYLNEKTADRLTAGYCLKNAEGTPQAYPSDQRITDVTVAKCEEHSYNLGFCTYCKTKDPNYVGLASVTINGTPTNYFDLSKAFEAADGNTATITMLENVQAYGLSLTGGTITLNLNGKKIETEDSYYNSILTIDGAEITIENGTLKHYGSGCPITLTSGKLLLKSTVTLLTLSNYGWGLKMDGGTAVIDGASFTDAKGYQSVQLNGGSLTINSGNFAGTVQVNDGKLQCKGGSFTDTRNELLVTFPGIQIGEDCSQTLADLLGDGYAFRSKAEGTAWVSDLSGKVLSNVTVEKAPAKITTQPTSPAAVKYGYAAADDQILTVTAEKVPADSTNEITYQWTQSKDGAAATNVGTEATCEIPTGLNAGSYVYTCVVTCDGYTVKTNAVTFTVNEAAGSITNKNTYQTAPTYTATEIANPAEGDFTTTAGALSYEWYSGNPASGEKLTENPKAVGTYTLRVSAEATDNVSAPETMDVPVTISYLQLDAGVVPTLPENVGDNGWYHGEVKLTPPEGYQISISGNTDLAKFFNAVWCDEDGSNDVTYYLRKIETGYITDAKTILVKYDGDKPTIGTIAYSEHSSFLDWIFGNSSIQVTVPVTDDTSGAASIAYVLKDGDTEIKRDTVDVVDGTASFHVNKTFVGTVTIIAYDKAGNASAEATAVKMYVEDNAPRLSVFNNLTSGDFDADSWYTDDDLFICWNAQEEQHEDSGLQKLTYTVDTDTTVKTLFDGENETGLVSGQEDGFVPLAGAHTYHFALVDNALNETTLDVTVKYDAAGPTQPTLTASNVTDHSMTLTATGSTDTGSGIKEYTLSGIDPSMLPTSTMLPCGTLTNATGVFEVNGLAPNTNYGFTVTVTDNAGNTCEVPYIGSQRTLKASLADATVELSNMDDLVFNGAIQYPTVTVKLNGDTPLADSEYTVSYYYRAETAASTPFRAGTYTVKVAASASGNYSGTAASQPTFSIAPKPIQGVLQVLYMKPYDGNTNCVAVNLYYTGGIEGAPAFPMGTVTYSYNSPNVAEATTVTSSNIVLDDSFYVLVNENGEKATTVSSPATITPKDATITANPQSITYGNEIAQTVDKVTANGLVNGETITGITLTASSNQVAAENKTITPSAAVISGDSAANYNITYATGALTINKADPTYDVPANLTAIYGQTLADVTLPTGWSWQDSTTKVGNVGANSFTATFTPIDASNYNAKNESVSVTVSQADPAIGAVSYTGDALYDSMAVNEVVLTRANEDVDGTLALDAGQTLMVGTKDYNWTFTPADGTNYTTATGKISLTVTADTLQSISIGSTAPNKKEYTYGDTFETAGLTVTATYAHRTDRDVTASVDFGALSGGDTSIELSYTEGGVTKTCPVSGLTVKKKQLDVSGMSWTTGSFTYNGDAQGLTLTGTLPTGVTVTKTGDTATNKGDYTAKATFALAGGYAERNYEIIGTKLLEQPWSIAQAALTGTKNPGLTLRYTTTATQTVAAADFGITAAGGFAANGAVTDAKNALNAAPTFGANVQYQLKTGLTFDSQTVTIPVTFTPTDTNYAPVDLSITVTLTDRNTVTLNLAASKTAAVVYGDSVTYTATLDKDHAFLNALDTLDGEVKFYLGDPANGGTLLDTKTVSGSGSTASVTLDFDKLTKGDHAVYAVYSGNTAFANTSASTTTSVAAKTLTWDASGLWAVKQYQQGDRTATVNGKLLVGGALEGTDPGFTYTTNLTGTYASDAAGSQTVTVTVTGAALSNANYALPSGNPTFIGTINAVAELPKPADVPDDGKEYKLEKEEGISEVPADVATKHPELNTPAAIETQMKVSITDANGNIPTANIEVYDVTLKFSEDNGKTWQVATGSNFPANGITVVLPYPDGTSQSGYDFVITHMFTTGDKAGTTETITPTKTASGLQFTVKSLSPIAIGYKTTPPSDGDNGSSGGGGGSSTTTYYTITTNAGAGGSFDTAQTVSVKAGESAGFTITPNKGYAIADVLVDGKSVDAVNTYVFTNVRANHTISATFKAAGHTNPQTGVGYDFTDVAETDWYYEDVMAACDSGWFAGTSATTFSPYSSMTRQMLWTVLGRINGETLSGSGVYDAARTWAMGAGITDGSNPAAALTREQLVTILWRYAGSPAATGDLTAFSDAASVTTYATDAMKWAVANGIVAGADGKLMPQGNATRAQVAAILNRYDEKFGK